MSMICMILDGLRSVEVIMVSTEALDSVVERTNEEHMSSFRITRWLTNNSSVASTCCRVTCDDMLKFYESNGLCCCYR